MKIRIPSILAILTFLCLAGLGPRMQAVNPPPDGGYPGGNTAEGHLALGSLTTGLYNNAVGVYSLLSVTTGNFNTATGAGTLLSNTGDQNTATGAGALFSNSTGEGNTANGTFALFNNTTASGNTAVGSNALFNNTTGNRNTAIGNLALLNNTGNENTAAGSRSLLSNTTGIGNTANGERALVNNVVGHGNTAIGQDALFENTSGDGNIALGVGAGQNLTTGDNNIDIGNQGNPGEANTIRIGTIGFQAATFIAGISGVSVTGTPVVVNGSGQLGVAPSSRRFKDKINPMNKTSEAIFALKPVTFRYKPELDSDGIPRFGLVAEEVEKVNPHLVARGAKGEIYTVRYDAVNAMLLNEFLKEHRKVKQQEATIAQLKEIEMLVARLNEQDSKIQRVSDQVEMNKARAQVASNDR